MSAAMQTRRDIVRDSNEAAEAINALNARRADRVTAAVNVLAAVALGIVGGLVLLKWASGCDVGYLCAAVITPTRRPIFARWATRLQLAARAWYLRRLIKSANDDIRWAEIDLVETRRELGIARVYVDGLNLRLRDCERATRDI